MHLVLLLLLLLAWPTVGQQQAPVEQHLRGGGGGACAAALEGLLCEGARRASSVGNCWVCEEVHRVSVTAGGSLPCSRLANVPLKSDDTQLHSGDGDAPSGDSTRWQRGDQVQLTVLENFTYTAAIAGSSVELTQGLVGLRCGGQYQSSQNGGLLPVGPQDQSSTLDCRLGQVDEVSQRFATAATEIGGGEVIASIRYLHEFDAFTFKLSFPHGANGTLAYPTPKSGATNVSTGLPLPGEWAGDAGGGKEPAGDDGSLEPALPLASHFPSFTVQLTAI